jgi:hypothetical protein
MRATLNSKEARLNFAKHCLELARKELVDHGRKFMKPNEDAFDSAVSYGGSIKLTREEAIKASQESDKHET